MACLFNQLYNIAGKQTRISELLCKNFAFQLLYQRNAYHLQQCRADKRLLEYNRDRLYERYTKWKNKTHAERQNILYLQQQILVLYNNPPNQINMADARRLPVLKLMAPALAKFQPYTGQEPPDDYLDKVIQSWAYLEGHMAVLEGANAGDFDDAVKCNILKSMMGRKYAPVPANNGLVVGNPAINSPDTLRAWMRAKYQRETVGNQQSAIQRSTQERYQPYDTPDTYEARIRLLLLGVVDNDVQVLGFLKSHLQAIFILG
ncbi:hypothetical protein C2G38_2098937 [Gigaspora rosea]|uniref:Uncharacterized protein n=1 Tax=Gigaspora rosea TaxID=44941 RepID=A0A397UTP2_9GLOM|nr:hypothetical protein C2G38_2098937 [Gigaspora rosea]